MSRAKTWLNRLIRLFRKPPEEPKIAPEEPAPRRIVDTETIRNRLKVQGWKLLEIPVKKNSPIPEERVVVRWRIIADRKGKNVDIGGRTIDEAISNLGKMLGVIAK